MATPIIHTEGLNRTFGAVHAVHNLSLDVPPGVIFGFLGPNGSGKTTTIRLLLGLLEPTCGTAEVCGFNTRTEADAIRQQVGTLLEHHGLYERLSATENLEFYGRIWRMPPAERQSRSRELLKQLGLWEQRDQPVVAWSRGMKQKLAVARALLHRPNLLFLDEPTAGLDPRAAAALRNDLTALVAQQGVTVFLTTHTLSEAEKLCDLVGVIRNGSLIALGSPDELRAQVHGLQVKIIGHGFTTIMLEQLQAQPQVTAVQQQHDHLTIRLSGSTDIAPLVSLLVGMGAQVEEVHRGPADLEATFLALMEETHAA